MGKEEIEEKKLSIKKNITYFYLCNRYNQHPMSELLNTKYNKSKSDAEKQMIKKMFWFLRDQFVLNTDNETDQLFKTKQKNEKGENIYKERMGNTTTYSLSTIIKIPKTKKYSTNTLNEISSTIVSMLSTDRALTDLLNIIISKTFKSEKTFVTDIVSKCVITMTNYHKKDEDFYPLDLLLFLIKTKQKINIEIETNSGKVNLLSTTLKSILFRKKSFDLVFKNTTVKMNDIREIKSIESFDNSDLRVEITKLESILSEYPTELTQSITELINGLKNIEDNFIF